MEVANATYQKRKWITITELSNFARCPRRFFYKVGLGLRDVGPVAPLVFGEAIHKALPKVLEDDSVESGLDAFLSLWDESVSDEKRNTSRARAMLKDFLALRRPPKSIYNLLHPPGGLIDISDRSSDWEIPFAIDIGLDIPLCGRIDGWAKHRDCNEKYAVEFKTSSEVSTRLFKGFETNPQIIGYATVLRVMGEDVKGTILDVLRVSNVRTETQSHLISVSSQMSDSFLKWANYIGSSILSCEELAEKMAKEEGTSDPNLDDSSLADSWPQQWSGCNPYAMFGMPGRTCEYTPLCKVQDWTSLTSIYETGRHIPFTLQTDNGDSSKETSNA